MTTNIKRFRSCELKGMILQSFSGGTKTAPAVFRDIQHPNRNSFDVAIHYLYVRGFIIRNKNGKKPYRYRLSSKGKLHAENPYITKEWRAKRTLKEVDNILLQNDRFMENVERISNQMVMNLGSSGGGGMSGGYHMERNPDTGEYFLEKDIDLTERDMEIQPGRRNKPDGYTDHDSNSYERKRRRSDLVLAYQENDLNLDKNFFRIWKGLDVYLMFGNSMTNLRKSAIELLTIMDKEVVRWKKKSKGHIKAKLQNEEIQACDIRIAKTDEKFVYFLSPYFTNLVKKRW